MYSLAPLPIPDSSNVYYGLLIYAIITIPLVFLSIKHMFGAEVRWLNIIPLATYAILSFAIWNESFTPKPVPTNTVVIGTLSNFGQYQIEEHYREGKNNRTRMVVNPSVTYSVPEGEVTFTRGHGIVYPPTVYLYKN